MQAWRGSGSSFSKGVTLYPSSSSRRCFFPFSLSLFTTALSLRTEGNSGPGFIRMLGYFLFVGIGFMFIEIPLIQRLILFLLLAIRCTPFLLASSPSSYLPAWEVLHQGDGAKKRKIPDCALFPHRVVGIHLRVPLASPFFFPGWYRAPLKAINCLRLHLSPEDSCSACPSPSASADSERECPLRFHGPGASMAVLPCSVQSAQ